MFVMQQNAKLAKPLPKIEMEKSRESIPRTALKKPERSSVIS
jgi:hypothetical protein